ncbi:MAG: hypothetical protein AAFZ09_00855, partial [Pseudomonadota bacterium]
MTLEIKLYGADPRAAADAAAMLLEEIAGKPPVRESLDEAGGERRDLGLAIAFAALAVSTASLIVSLPAAMLAALELRDRLDRGRLRDRVEAVQRQLGQDDAEATITTPVGTEIDLRRTATDHVVDLILRDLGA